MFPFVKDHFIAYKYLQSPNIDRTEGISAHHTNFVARVGIQVCIQCNQTCYKYSVMDNIITFVFLMLSFLYKAADYKDMTYHKTWATNSIDFINILHLFFLAHFSLYSLPCFELLLYSLYFVDLSPDPSICTESNVTMNTLKQNSTK